MRSLLDAIVGRVTKSYVAVVETQNDYGSETKWQLVIHMHNNSRRKGSQDRQGRETPLPKKQLLKRGRVAAAEDEFRTKFFSFPICACDFRNHQMLTQIRRLCHLQQSSAAYYLTGRALQINRRIMTLMGRVRKSAWTLALRSSISIEKCCLSNEKHLLSISACLWW